MNKKTLKIASGAAGIILAVSACGTDTYEYEVSGILQGQQLDYDCPGEDIAMGAVAFVSGSKPGGSNSSTGKKSSDSADSDSGSSDSKAQGKDKLPATTPTKAATKAPSTGSGTNKRSASPVSTPSPTVAKVKNKGVELKKKPEKPEKLKSKKLPKLKYKFKPKGCETEYEIFVLADDGYLYEQDVRKVDYDKCLAAEIPAGKKNKIFPLCTKG